MRTQCRNKRLPCTYRSPYRHCYRCTTCHPEHWDCYTRLLPSYKHQRRDRHPKGHKSPGLCHCMRRFGKRPSAYNRRCHCRTYRPVHWACCIDPSPDCTFLQPDIVLVQDRRPGLSRCMCHPRKHRAACRHCCRCTGPHCSQTRTQMRDCSYHPYTHCCRCT